VVRSIRQLGVLAICTTVIGMSSMAAAEGAVREVHAHSFSAAAPSVTQNHKQPYNEHWSWKSAPLGTCTVLRVTGYFKYSTTTGRNNVQYTNQVLYDPRLTAHVYKLKKGKCTSRPFTVSKFQIAQHWTGYACSFNPSISVSAGIEGLSVGISGWPSCGQRTQAIYSTPYGAGHYAIQDNTGSPVQFGNDTQWGSPGNPPPALCYGVYASAIIWRPHHSDSFGSGNLHHSAKICFTS
jgi:hypothetical protein